MQEAIKQSGLIKPGFHKTRWEAISEVNHAKCSSWRLKHQAPGCHAGLEETQSSTIAPALHPSRRPLTAHPVPLSWLMFMHSMCKVCWCPLQNIHKSGARMAAFSLLEVIEETAKGERHWRQGAEKAIWAWEPKPCYLLLREMTVHQLAQERAFTPCCPSGKGKDYKCVWDVFFYFKCRQSWWFTASSSLSFHPPEVSLIQLKWQDTEEVEPLEEQWGG